MTDSEESAGNLMDFVVRNRECRYRDQGKGGYIYDFERIGNNLESPGVLSFVGEAGGDQGYESNYEE